MRREVSIACALWVAGTVAGWLACWQLGISADGKGLAQILGLGTGDGSNIPATATLFLHIIKRNMLVLGVLLSGLVTWGVAAAATLLYNGFRLGWIVGLSQLLGIPSFTVTLALLPHGLFELAGFIAGGAVGLRGWALARSAQRSGRFQLDGDAGSLIRGSVVGICAVLMAALVEATVTRAVVLRMIGNG